MGDLPAVDHLMAGNSASPRIVWFRDDLRLSDHPALHAASRAGAPVICLYVLDETSNAQLRPLGGAARWWLAQSLRALQASLIALGSTLVLRRGPAAKVIAALARETGAAAVFWNEIAQAPHRAVAEQVAAACRRSALPHRAFPATCWRPRFPSAPRKDGACGYSRRSGGGCSRRAIRRSRCRPRRRSVRRLKLASDRLETWRLEPAASRLGRRPAPELETGREFGTGPAQRIS